MRNTANIRQRSDGRYEARYISGRNPDGSVHYASVYGATPEEADANRTAQQIKLRAEKRASDTSSIKSSRMKVIDPLDEETVGELEKVFDNNRDAFGFTLCLYLGISFGELCALKYSDFDDITYALTVRREMSSQNATKGEIFAVPARTFTLPLPMQRILRQTEHEADNYVLTDSPAPVESTVSAGYMLKRLLNSFSFNKSVQPDALQMTFIRRACESGLSIETIEAVTGIEARTLKRRFEMYAVPDVQAVRFMAKKYIGNKLTPLTRSMNLLILGAGSHGHTVKETAELLGVFNKISFLDDNATGANIIGKCDDYPHLIDEYPTAFVAIGNNALRREFTEKLKSAGFILPRLIHPDTTISRDVSIGDGTIICAQATVNTGAVIGEGCIVATNAMVGFDAHVGVFSHIDCGAMVMKNATVDEMTSIESGSIVKNEK